MGRSRTPAAQSDARRRVASVGERTHGDSESVPRRLRRRHCRTFTTAKGCEGGCSGRAATQNAAIDQEARCRGGGGNRVVGVRQSSCAARAKPGGGAGRPVHPGGRLPQRLDRALRVAVIERPQAPRRRQLAGPAGLLRRRREGEPRARWRYGGRESIRFTGRRGDHDVDEGSAGAPGAVAHQGRRVSAAISPLAGRDGVEFNYEFEGP